MGPRNHLRFFAKNISYAKPRCSHTNGRPRRGPERGLGRLAQTTHQTTHNLSPRGILCANPRVSHTKWPPTKGVRAGAWPFWPEPRATSLFHPLPSTLSLLPSPFHPLLVLQWAPNLDAGRQLLQKMSNLDARRQLLQNDVRRRCRAARLEAGPHLTSSSTPNLDAGRHLLQKSQTSMLGGHYCKTTPGLDVWPHASRLGRIQWHERPTSMQDGNYCTKK